MSGLASSIMDHNSSIDESNHPKISGRDMEEVGKHCSVKILKVVEKVDYNEENEPVIDEVDGTVAGSLSGKKAVKMFKFYDTSANFFSDSAEAIMEEIARVMTAEVARNRMLKKKSNPNVANIPMDAVEQDTNGNKIISVEISLVGSPDKQAESSHIHSESITPNTASTVNQMELKIVNGSDGHDVGEADVLGNNGMEN